MLEQLNLNAPKMSKEEYKPIHDELVKKLVVLQQEARRKGVGLVVLFEGWSGAGKGSRISDLMYELDARATSVHVTEDIDVKAAFKFAGTEWGVTGYCRPRLRANARGRWLRGRQALCARIEEGTAQST
jgi:hypothetical protein